jgi:hypothetical protein
MMHEPRTLHQLHHELETLDPGRRADDLTRQLMQHRDRLHDLDEQLAVPRDPKARELLGHERQHLTDRVAALVRELDQERDRLHRDRLYRRDPATPLRDAIATRERALLPDTLATRPAWLTRLLTDLHQRGTLEQLPDHVLVGAIHAVATYRDRWNITRDDPLGPDTPAANTAQHQDWRKLAARLQQGHVPARSGPMIRR